MMSEKSGHYVKCHKLTIITMYLSGIKNDF
jgi:hypothetical protein